MDLRRLRPAEWMIGGWGLLLLVALFVPWYGAGGAEGGWTMYAPLASGGNATGWESLGVLDVVLAAIALAAIAVPFVAGAYRVPAVPLALESLLALVALVGSLLVLFRLIDLPDWAGDRELGVWAALVATVGIFGSCLVAMRDERMPFGSRPEIETLPAPRAEAGP
jgi:hypothetical protein